MHPPLWRRAPLFFVAVAAFLTLPVAAQQHTPQQIAEDAMRHRALAQAQEIASQCFANKKGEDVCLAEMNTLCIGLAIGKFCGLRKEAFVDPVASFRITSKANLEAAQCMESGKPYEDCIWDLQTACHGLGIGKYCGMVHSHA